MKKTRSFFPVLVLTCLAIAHLSFADAAPGANFDGSVNFENPEVLADGALLPVQQGSGQGFCASKKLYFVSSLAASQNSGTTVLIGDDGRFAGLTTDTAYLSLAVCVSANATGPADTINVGVVNFDGSMTYDNPTLLVDGKQMPIVYDEQGAFCYRKGMCLVTESKSGTSAQSTPGIDLSSNTWTFSGSSFVLQSVTCRNSQGSQADNTCE